MSRVGPKPIEIPNGVEVGVTGDNLYTVKEPKGELVRQMPKEVIIRVEDNTITISGPSEVKRHKSFYGLTRTPVSNMIEGVTGGHKRTLIIEGTGYRVTKQDKKLVLNSGYSHTIGKGDPEGVSVEVPEQYILTIGDINKQQVGNCTAKTRDLRGPESYKGKGARYEDEHIRRKADKTGR